MTYGFGDVMGDLGAERRLSRRRMLQLGGGLAALVGMGPVLAACDDGSAGSAAVPTGPLNLGVAKPTTGSLVAAYKPLFAPLQIAVDSINKAGGILGREIKLDVADDQGAAAQEGTVARKLISDGCAFIVGPVGSSQGTASLQATQGRKVIQIPFVNDTALSDPQKYPGSYIFAQTTAQNVKTLVQYLVNDAHTKKAAVMYENTAYGQASAPDAIDQLKAAGVQVVAVEVYESGAVSMASNVRRIQSAGADGMLLVSSPPADSIKVFQAMYEADFQPVVVASSVYLHRLVQLLPANVKFPPEFISAIRAPCYRALSWSPGKPIDAQRQAYVTAVAKHPDGSANVYANAQGPFYDAMFGLKQAIESARSFEYDAVIKELNNLTFEGMIGTIRFSATSHAGVTDDSIAIGQVTDLKATESLGWLPMIAPDFPPSGTIPAPQHPLAV